MIEYFVKELQHKQMYLIESQQDFKYIWSCQTRRGITKEEH